MYLAVLPIITVVPLVGTVKVMLRRAAILIRTNVHTYRNTENTLITLLAYLKYNPIPATSAYRGFM